MTAKYRTTNIAQGEYAVSESPDEIISTLLGSCVGVCLHDPSTGTGGMNHILLPDNCGQASNSASIGVNAMELLINAMIKIGANRSMIKAKVFGGSCMVKGLSSIGARNVEFVNGFLKAENIPMIGGNTGGDEGRRIQFWPHTGAARQKLLGAAMMPETVVRPKAPEPEPMNGLELF